MYTPQQDEVVERKNITIMNMAINMLKVKNLSNVFWGATVAYAVYILNLSPTSNLKDIVPQEA